MTSLPFYLLPQDIIDYVAAEFVANMGDVARLDSATCCASSRPMLLHSMRTIHCTTVVIGRVRDESGTGTWRFDDVRRTRSILDWMLSRRFAVSKLIVCPFALSVWEPNVWQQENQVVVGTLGVIVDSLSHGGVVSADLQTKWRSRFRWSEVEWSDSYSTQTRMSRRVQGFSDSTAPLLPVDRLTSIYLFDEMTLDQTPHCLLSQTGSLRSISVTATDDSIQHWIRILVHNRVTLEELDISVKTTNEHNTNYTIDVVDLRSSWPVLVSVSVSWRSSTAVLNANRLLTALVEGADNMRKLYISCPALMSETAVALLKHVIWRPRDHICNIALENIREDIPHPFPEIGTWVTDNPAETLWSAASDAMSSNLWQYLPMEKQLFDDIYFPIPQSVPLSCLRSASQVGGEEVTLTEIQWRTVLRSPRLFHIKVIGRIDEFVRALETLAQEATVVPGQRIRWIRIESNVVSHSPSLLPNLATLFGSRLEEVVIEGVHVSFDSMVQFVKRCPELSSVTMNYVDMPMDGCLIKHESNGLNGPIKRLRPCGDMELYICLVWPIKHSILWEEFVQSVTKQELMWAALASAFKHHIFAPDYCAPKEMTLKLRFRTDSEERDDIFFVEKFSLADLTTD